MNTYLVSYAYNAGKGVQIADITLHDGPALTEKVVARMRWTITSNVGTPVAILAITKLDTP